MLAALLPVLGSIFGQVAKSLFPDPADETKRKEIEATLQSAIIQNSADIERAAGEIVKAEAASNSWLAANWRPLTMLVFVSLIVARWLGWTAPGMTEAEYLSIYDLIKIGLGGYVVGRSAEKMLPGIIAALKK